MLKTQLNIDAVKKVAEAAAVIGEGTKIEINGYHYKTREEAQETAELVANELGLEVFEGEAEKVKTGWFTLSESRYGGNIFITLYFDLQAVVTNA